MRIRKLYATSMGENAVHAVLILQKSLARNLPHQRNLKHESWVKRRTLL